MPVIADDEGARRCAGRAAPDPRPRPAIPSSRSRISRAPRRRSPASTARDRGSCAWSSPHRRQAPAALLQDLARDDHLLHLVGALADLGQLGVAQVALDVELARVAVAAVDLDGGVAGAHRRRARRSTWPSTTRAWCAALLVLQPAPRARPAGARRPARSPCRRACTGSPGSRRWACRTARAPWRSGAPPRARRGRCRPPRRRCRCAPCRGSCSVSKKPWSSSPRRCASGTSHVLEDELGGVGGVQAHLLDALAGAEAGRAALDDERGQPLAASSRARSRRGRRRSRRPSPA